MDPDACWKRMCDAYDADDCETAAEAARDIQTWVNKGGFKPQKYDEVILRTCLIADRPKFPGL